MFDFHFSDPQFLPHVGCDISLRLLPGRVTVLTGENGIGKSTLLHKIFSKQGQRVIALSDQKPMDIFFDRKLKTFKEILFQGSNNLNRGFFEKYWKLSGLGPKEDRFLSLLSGGEAQLLKIISVCSGNAEIYLLDEPGQYLDSEKKKLVNIMLEELSQSGKAVLVVEHEPAWLSKTTLFKFVEEENILRVVAL